MSKWDYKIDLTAPFVKFELGEMTVEQVSANVHSILRNFVDANPDLDCYDIEDTIDSLKYCNDADDFDNLMADLYDFADYNRLWIDTMNFDGVQR
jgi:hypothetical protein